MILLNIASENEKTIEKIAELLLTKKLAVDINLKVNVTRLSIVDDKIEKQPIYVITAKTKALLFNKIEELIKETFKDQTPELFSLPITTMEIKQAEEIINNTQKV
ncbi:MAG: divalent cation tolerance protein CutA [Bacteroidetes bacterium]|nr:divalent cation tolerance protein CutA [Bacteroidota bacterium]